jgi:hypothetical protein
MHKSLPSIIIVGAVILAGVIFYGQYQGISASTMFASSVGKVSHLDNSIFTEKQIKEIKFSNSQPKPASQPTLKQGIWGGMGINLDVGDTIATVEFDCASGSFGLPVEIISSGDFKAEGKYIFEQGGPFWEGDTGKLHPTTYSGILTGTTLKLSIILQDTNQDIGTYSLTYGVPGKIFKCL